MLGAVPSVLQTGDIKPGSIEFWHIMTNIFWQEQLSRPMLLLRIWMDIILYINHEEVELEEGGCQML